MQLNKITRLLIEERSNKDNNPKYSAYEELEKYKDNPNIFISFRSIDRVGINPKSSFDTPNGVYAYPLREMWDQFDHTKKKIIVPFAGHNPYIYVLETKGNGIDNINDYTREELINDAKKLAKVYGTKTINKLLKDSKDESLFDSYGGRLWYLTMKLNEIHNNGSTVKWSAIFSKILGYNYIAERTIVGVIHRHEPIQAVFFNKAGYDVVDKIINDKDKKETYNTSRIAFPQWYKDALSKHRQNKAKVTDDSENTDYPNSINLTNIYWKNGTWNGVPNYHDEKNNIIWHNGKFIYGYWKSGIWLDGEWYNGLWNSGIWKSGTWHKGTWREGLWYKGTWYDGTWEGGSWYNGTWQDGIWHGGEWRDGYWAYGVWKDGHWYKGIWETGEWLGGTWHNGEWRDGIWEDGLWKRGHWNRGEWRGGIWEGGGWDRGKWLGGTWKDGYIRDQKKEGNYQKDWEWMGEYVRSPISPAEYFKKD